MTSDTRHQRASRQLTEFSRSQSPVLLLQTRVSGITSPQAQGTQQRKLVEASWNPGAAPGHRDGNNGAGILDKHLQGAAQCYLLHTLEERGELAVKSEKKANWLSIERKRPVGCQFEESVNNLLCLFTHPLSQKKKTNRPGHSTTSVTQTLNAC
jgi:hypothetical protein